MHLPKCGQRSQTGKSGGSSTNEKGANHGRGRGTNGSNPLPFQAGHIKEAIQECTEILQNGDPNDVDVLCDRAEAHLLDENYDAAIEDYKKAQEVQEGNQRAREGLDRAQKLKKQAGKRDYYKILGVKRNANKREVIKAYRKMAQKWHPDNFSDADEKKKAEAKFIDIAAAKEVLSDDGLPFF